MNITPEAEKIIEGVFAPMELDNDTKFGYYIQGIKDALLSPSLLKAQGLFTQEEVKDRLFAAYCHGFNDRHYPAVHPEQFPVIEIESGAKAYVNSLNLIPSPPIKSAEKFLKSKGIFALDTKKRMKEVCQWMEEYASQFTKP